MRGNYRSRALFTSILKSGEESLEEVQLVSGGGAGLRLQERPRQGELQHNVIMGLIRKRSED